MKPYSVSLFLPVYNYSTGKLVKNVRLIHGFLENNYAAFELIIVDDNSNSETKKALDLLRDKFRISILIYENGPSRRENLAASFEKAKNDIICFMDIDLAVDLTFLLPLTDSISGGYDICIGSRYKGIRPERKAQRKIISFSYKWVLKILFGTKVQDHTCGFKAFKKDEIQPLIRSMGYDTSKRRGWFWDAELLIRAQDTGYEIEEIPVAWKADNESTFSIRREARLIPYVLSFWIYRLRQFIIRKRKGS